MSRFISRFLTALFVVAPLLSRAAEPSSALPGSPLSDPSPAVALYDTGRPLPTDPANLLSTGDPTWRLVAEDDTDHRFRGDIVVRNDRLAVVLRRGQNRADLYARGSDGFSKRVACYPSGPPAATPLEVMVRENSGGEAVLELRTGPERWCRYALAIGQPFVRVESSSAEDWLAIEAPCRYVALPDFFADDIVVDATEVPVSAAELPSENFLLHFLPGGDSLVMSVAGSSDQDARVTFSGEGSDRRIDRSLVSFGQQRRIWVAVLETPQIWHEQVVESRDADKVLELPWTQPFAAQWRVNWRRSDGLTNSWEMIAEKHSGEFEKYGWFGSPHTIPADRRRWTTVIGWFAYPCWIDRAGRGHLQPMKKGRFSGPVLIYPINRVAATPLSAYTLVDVVRGTLGVGPCEYILDVEGQGASMQGRATCPTRDALKAIYSAGQQQAKRREIEKILDEVNVFVTHIRARIEEYRKFGREMSEYLAEQKDARPELTAFLTEMDTLAQGVEKAYQQREGKIQTPQYVRDLTDEFHRTLLDAEGPEALARCTQITEAIVIVGGNQDELVGECRQAVKVLRQRAGLAMATEPRAAAIAEEIRARTQKVLRNAASYEAPRH